MLHRQLLHLKKRIRNMTELEQNNLENELSKCFLNYTVNPENNIQKLVEYIGKFTNADAASFSKIDNNLLCCISKWNIPDDYYPIDNPEGHVCTDLITKNKDFLYIEDLNQTEYKNTDKNVKQFGLVTYIGKAIKIEGYTVGCLNIVYKEKKSLNEEIKWLLNTIASAISTEESRRTNYNAIKKSNIILNVALELTSEIILDDKETNIKKILETIGIKLEAKKIFLLRFPVLDSNYIEWIRPGFESYQKQERFKFEDDKEYDISQLIEWVYTGKSLCINIENPPVEFKLITRTNSILNYHKILVPILINEKPWGIMGMGQIRTTPINDMITTSFINLCKVISLVIKQKEEQEKINHIIDKKLIEFKQKAKIFNQ